MRSLVVIPHYFGPFDPGNRDHLIGSYIEPLGRIAGLSESIASLHRHFGPYRTTFEGTPVASEREPDAVDIVIVAREGSSILPQLALDPGIISVEYVTGEPRYIPFHAQRLMKERAGRYDYYCLMEDDLAIHDPAFFAKLAWFERNFGPRALLAPTRVETASSGTPGKVIIDPLLSDELLAPFRREGQRETLRASWHGEDIAFHLPGNPHAASFFLSARQFEHWMAQPSYDDRDESWVGPIESAVTFGIGKVFDIYKAVRPDPFFLEVHHYGVGYASRNPPQGRRHGGPPLLAIAQGAVRAALAVPGEGGEAVGLQSAMQAWSVEETASEQCARLTAELIEQQKVVVGLQQHVSVALEHIERLNGEAAANAAQHAELTRERDALVVQAEELKSERDALRREGDARAEDFNRQRDLHADEIAGLRGELFRRKISLRWLLPSLGRELSRRLLRRPATPG